MPAGGCVTALADLQKTLQQIHQRMGSYIDKDALAFNKVMAALKVKKNFGQDNKNDEIDTQSAMLGAIEVPLAISRDIDD